MQKIIKTPPQAFGKGFYVSTNPYDSSWFGNGVTAFKTVSPLVTIQLYFRGERIRRLMDKKLNKTDISSIKKLVRFTEDNLEAYQESLNLLNQVLAAAGELPLAL